MALAGAKAVALPVSLGITQASHQCATVHDLAPPTLRAEKLGARLRNRVQGYNAARPLHLPIILGTASGRPLISPPKASAQSATTQTSQSAESHQGTENSHHGNGIENGDIRTVRIELTPLTPENFAPFGQVCGPCVDGAEFGTDDAQLELEGGVPRLYILRLKGKELKFDRITHHARVTQCLGSADGRPWYMGVAPASLLSDVPGEDGRLPWAPPKLSDVRVFRVEGPAFLKLNKGTWHAGPLFEDPQMDFYNLEHTDTNVTDHNTHVFSREDGCQFVIDTAS